MDAVLAGGTKRQRRKTLLEMTNGFGLDDAYKATLDRIREQGRDRERLAMGVLMWVSCSERPLKAGELRQALGVEVGTTDLDVDNVPAIQTLIGSTLGLVTIDEPASTVRLVHFTLQEYLAAHPDLFTTPHSMMAEICLTYLNFQSVCGLPTTLHTIPSTMPFLYYASCSWGFHARKEITESVKRLASQVLERDANHISADILLHEESIDFMSWWDRSLGSHPDLDGFTGLHCIAYMGVKDIAIALIDMGGRDLKGRDSNGATPLMWAAKYGNYELAELLLSQGDHTLSDHQGLVPLTHAAKSGHEDIVRLFLERGDVNPNWLDLDGRTPLSHAARFGHEGVVKLLLGPWGVDPDSPDKNRRTPLSYAAGSGHEGVVKILLERDDVDPDSSRKSHQTPLSFAARSEHEGFVNRALGRWDVSPNSCDVLGRTPLSYAAESACEGVVKLLLERQDVNPDSSDKNLRTPLSYAAGLGHRGVVTIFLA